jgi:hypothetical protein
LNLGKLKADQLAVGPDGDFLFVASESELWGCSIESAGVVGKPIRVAKVASPGRIRDLAVDGRCLVSVVHGGGVDVHRPKVCAPRHSQTSRRSDSRRRTRRNATRSDQGFAVRCRFRRSDSTVNNHPGKETRFSVPG